MYPTIFETDLFGLLDQPLPITVYGLFIAGGFITALSLATRQAPREGLNPDHIQDMGFYLLVWGLIGARIVFILTNPRPYLDAPFKILKFWEGGVVWYGGFIGAALYLVVYSKKHEISFFRTADLLIPYMTMAHGLGRLGCLSAGCCFGKPTTLPWGIVFPVGSMPHQAQHGDGLVGLSELPHAVHPTQLYEAGAEFFMFWLLLWLRPKKRFHGQLFLVWMAAYSVIRTTIELFRGDKIRGVFVLSTSQYISIGIAITAAILVWRFARERKSELAA